MGLRVGSFEFRVKDFGSIAFQITNRYIRHINFMSLRLEGFRVWGLGLRL